MCESESLLAKGLIVLGHKVPVCVMNYVCVITYLYVWCVQSNASAPCSVQQMAVYADPHCHT